MRLYLVPIGTIVRILVLVVRTGTTPRRTPTTTSGRVSSVTQKRNNFLGNWTIHYQKIHKKWSAILTSLGEYIKRFDITPSREIERWSQHSHD